jgi:hypothetical protein
MNELLAGGKAGIDQINGLNKELDSVSSSLGRNASTALYQAGVDAAAGLVKGLEKQQAAIEKLMDKIADSMVRALKKKLGIKSPSKVFAELGKFTGQGLAKGLNNSASEVAKSSEGVANTAVDSLRRSLSGMHKMTLGDVDMRPVIRPVLDLTDVQKTAGKIGGLLPSAKMNVSAAYANASDASAAIRANRTDGDDSSSSGSESRNITFNQYNSSPKAMSNAEIYRNTKNQISVAKGALEPNAK